MRTRSGSARLAPLARLARLAPIAALAGALLAPPLAAEAVGPAPALDPSKALLLEAGIDASRKGGIDAASFQANLSSALEREASDRGLAVSEAALDLGLPEPAAAQAAAAQAGARWVILARCSLEGEDRVAWRASIYDGSDGGLLGSDSFSAYAGLSALPLIESSAKRTFEAAWKAKEAAERPLPIGWRLSFRSPAEGASVSLASDPAEEGSGLPLGTIKGGGLAAPYLPLMAGTRIALGQAKEGYWPRIDRVRIGKTDEPLALPPLYKITRSAFSLDYGLGRLLGIEASYRYYLLPDSLYLAASESLWAAYDFLPGSNPVYHDEVRLGAAFYPFFSPSAPLRLSLGSGLSGIATYVKAAAFEDPVFFDFLLEPVFFTLELHFPERAYFIQGRFPYSLGASSGLLPQGWARIQGGAPLFTAGVLWKW